jgi:hypothetical protein
MIEIDEYARRAVESPVAQPPEMATLTSLANRHRRRRRGVRATLALGLAGSAVAAILVLSSLPSDNSGLRVAATSPKTTTSTTNTGSSESHELTIAGLSDRLTRAGHIVAADGTASGYPFGVDAHLLCVDGIQMRVYQYADAAARASISAGIRADGSSIEVPLKGSTNRVIVEWSWVGPPHFFANGRIIVLVLQDDGKLLRDLTRILGPTVSSRALPQPSAMSPCTTKATAAP